MQLVTCHTFLCPEPTGGYATILDADVEVLRVQAYASMLASYIANYIY